MSMKLRDNMVSLNKYKSLSSGGPASSEFSFLESEASFVDADQPRRGLSEFVPAGPDEERGHAVRPGD